MSDTLTVCVFAASSTQVPDSHRVQAHSLGAGIATRGWRLVYGGGDIGLMGEVARTALAGGAHVTGVIPRRMVAWEAAMEDLDEVVVTDTMRERQALMDARSDAFVALPGGVGTLAELLEIVTRRQLGYHDRPVVLLDPDGYWDPLRQQLAAAIDRGLAPASAAHLFTTAAAAEDALARIAAEVQSG